MQFPANKGLSNISNYATGIPAAKYLAKGNDRLTHIRAQL